MDFSGYLTLADGSSWSPTQQYYCKLISRLLKGEAPDTVENLLLSPFLLSLLSLLSLRPSTIQLVGPGV